MQTIKGFPSTSMNDYQLNTTTIIKHAVRNFPEREILYKTSSDVFRYTYRNAYERMMRIANVLKKLEIRPGDRVGVLDWNSHRHYELYFAISGSGAVILQMNLRIPPGDLSYVVNHSEAQLIFVDESLLGVAEAIAPELKTVKGYIIMTEKKLSELKTTLGPVYIFEDLLKEADPSYDWPMIDETCAYSACYTSGTTGKPKGVYYSHRDIYLHTMELAGYLRMNCNDCYIAIVPMFHGQSWGLFFAATFAGAKLIFPGRYVAEDPGPLIELMTRERVTVTSGAPAIFMPMLNYIRGMKEKPDFHGARFLSGATEPPLVMMKGWKELTGADIIHAYGATETTPVVTMNILKPSLNEKLNDVEKWELKRKQGLVVTGIDVEVVDAEGKEVPHDGQSIGEVLIRGPWITASYYNDSRTEESFHHGFWKSGDAGTIDSEGYLKIVDRYKDVIKSGGEWISSVDLENAIMGYPGVEEAVVVGLSHPKWEERPLALVVLSKELQDKLTKEEIIDSLQSRFARWQLPDDILFVKEIPKTSVGKFNKKVIRQAYQDYYIK